MPVVLAAGMLKMRMDMAAHDRCEHLFLESARFSAEAVSSIRTVAALMLEPNIVRKYGKKLDEVIASATKSSLTFFIIYALCDSLDLLGTNKSLIPPPPTSWTDLCKVMALVFWYGGKLVSEHQVTVDKYFIVYTCLMFGGQAAGFALGFASSTFPTLC